MSVISVKTHILYAYGYLELALLKEARAELALIAPKDRETTEVILVRIELAMAEGKWREVTQLAPMAVREDSARERPWVAWAYALRELNLVEDAFAVLSQGAPLIAKPSVLIEYNLACYECLLGELAAARKRLARVFKKEPGWKAEAAQDPDLAALHAELGG